MPIAVLWVFVDFVALPSSAGARQLLRRGWETVFPVARSGQGWIIDADIHRDPSGISLDFDLERYEEPSKIGDVFVIPRRHLSGWWAPTEESFNPSLHLAVDASVTLDEQARIRTLFADHMQSLDYGYMPEFAQWIRDGRTRVQRTLTIGYVRNGLSLFWTSVMIAGMTLRSRNVLRRRRQSRAASRGLCPRCEFDLQHKLDAGCPECGWRREN